MNCNIELFLILLVEWQIVTEIVSESYTKSYDGYVFTSPFFNPYKTKYEAQMWCVQNGSKLLDIKSSYVQNLTIRFLNDWPTGVQYPDGAMLITDGIRNGVGWNWVNYQGIYPITVSGQGSDLANSFGFINFDPSRLYITASIPTEMRSYICQVAGRFGCTNGFSKNGICFQSFSSPRLSWFDARNRCLNDGGDLASFDFINNDQELNSTLYGSWLNSSTTYWIGIRRQWWTWQTSNVEANYTNWMNGRPVYLLANWCLCLSKSGTDWKWIECNCVSALPFVCLTEPPTTLSVSTSTVGLQTSSGFSNITDAYSKTSAIGSTWSTAIGLAMASTNKPNGDSALGIGLGVGIGGALIITAIILAAIFVIRKRGCPRWFEKTPKSNPPDVILHPIIPDHYAEIPNQTGSGNNPTLDTNQSQSTLPVVYADLEIVTGSSPSHENYPVSLLSSRTATLLSPPISHKTTTHFTVDGQEYAEVKAI